VRGKRIKIAPEDGDAVYHCVTRTLNGERLFIDLERELLRRQIWLVADYCGVQVLTYAILSNHFHVLVRVPKKEPITDAELLRRYSRMYPKPTDYQTARLDLVRAQLQCNGALGVQWRERQLRQMGDVSTYLKLVKQRFSTGFNKRNQRFGTLWSERFKSTLVEPGKALRVVAAYIDLNPVRAGLVADPKDYRFCGYAEAVAGRREAIDGLCHVLGEKWEETSAGYRMLLFGTAAEPLTNRRRITEAAFQRVIAEGGKLSITALLRCRVRYFADSGILGSKAFVQAINQRLRRQVRLELPSLSFTHGLEDVFAGRRRRGTLFS